MINYETKKKGRKNRKPMLLAGFGEKNTNRYRILCTRTVRNSNVPDVIQLVSDRNQMRTSALWSQTHAADLSTKRTFFPVVRSASCLSWGLCSHRDVTRMLIWITCKQETRGGLMSSDASFKLQLLLFFERGVLGFIWCFLYIAHLAENYYSTLQVPTDGFIFHCY